MAPDEGMHRLSTQDAAVALGISVEALRQRIRRGSVRSEKDADGSVWVYVQYQDKIHTDDHIPTGPYSDLLADKDSQIEHLRQQLDRADERDREQRRIIAALTSRIPALPPAGESAESAPPQPPSVDHQETTAPSAPPHQQQRPWWRRVFR
jgi:hypothetical protein